MNPLTFTQPSCLQRLRVTPSLILVLAEYMVSLTCRGRVLVETALFKDQDGTDTALTEVCFSQLGTGPMWPFTRFVSFTNLACVIIFIESSSKCCSSMLLTLPKRIVTINSFG